MPLQPGEKGMSLGHRGENYTVIEGWQRGTKVYECGSFGYTSDNQNKRYDRDSIRQNDIGSLGKTIYII